MSVVGWKVQVDEGTCIVPSSWISEWSMLLTVFLRGSSLFADKDFHVKLWPNWMIRTYVIGFVRVKLRKLPVEHKNNYSKHLSSRAGLCTAISCSCLVSYLFWDSAVVWNTSWLRNSRALSGMVSSGGYAMVSLEWGWRLVSQSWVMCKLSCWQLWAVVLRHTLNCYALKWVQLPTMI